MSGDATKPTGAQRSPAGDEQLYQGLPPRLIARLIRSLDSRLVDMSYEQGTDGPVLRYRFEVAGKLQDFAVAVRAETLVSIVDLYPEARAFEQALEQQHGIRFLLPGAGEQQ
jgi:hypothetical protein